MTDILTFRIGLVIGLLNEKNNQIIDMKIKNKKTNDDEEVIEGNATMLMNM